MSWFWQLTWVLLQEFSASHSSSGMISFSLLDHKIYLLCHIKVINMDFFTGLFLFTMQWETFVLQMSHGHKLDTQTYFSKESFLDSYLFLKVGSMITENSTFFHHLCQKMTDYFSVIYVGEEKNCFS